MMIEENLMKKRIGYLVTIFILLLVFALLSLTVMELRKYVSFQDIIEKKIIISDSVIANTSYLLDSEGNIYSEIYSPTNSIHLQDDEIPSILKEVFVYSEDQHFFEHQGFDITAIGRALLINSDKQETEQGASTITQQLARNIMQSFEKTYNRKLRELLYAFQIEKTWTKEKILSEYINTIYYANNNYGIEAAANFYFSRSVIQLTHAELIFLASIPNNPTLYNPVTSFDNTKKRQERLIDIMVLNNSISEADANEWKAETITLTIKKKIDLYPDYTTYVEAEFRELVANKYGFSEKQKEANEETREELESSLDKQVETLLKSGIFIHTALQPDLQTIAVNATNQALTNIDVQGAVVAMDQNNHTITAIVGGKNYQKYDFNRSFQALRQPGSSIKPLLVYAPYIQETHSPISKQVSADAFCKGNYCPSNYSGSNYGMVSLETAFKYSYNTPAVRLMDQIGIDVAFSYLQKFPFHHLVKDDYNLSAALGGFYNGMTLLEMTDAYTTFGNNGNFQQARAITKVTDTTGNTILEWDHTSAQIWDESTNQALRDLLSATVKSGTAMSAAFPSSYLGAKTGTTNDYHDFWVIGLTNEKTVGVWIGKDTPANLKDIESQKLQLKIWKDVISP